jgi:hypothetical protein
MVNILGANSVSGGYEIDNSLRFNDGDSAKLGLAFGSGGNTKTWTVSCWFKRGIISSRQSFLNVGSSGSEYMSLYIDSDDKLYWVTESGGNLYRIGSSALFRDPSAWYHIVFRQDTTDGTANNRFRYYINGAEVDTGALNAQPTQNFDGKIGGNDTHYIGSNRDGNGEFMDGYLTEYHYLDGISYDPTYFGEFDDNGVWIPKKYTGSYGTKGFYLEFKETGTSQNSSGIGADTSGNDNHWAVTNLTASDVVIDTPTNNFATFNPLAARHDALPTLSQGNLSIATQGTQATISMPSGKWYMEVLATSGDADYAFGITEIHEANSVVMSGGDNPRAGFIYQANSNVRQGGTGTVVANYATYTNGDILSFSYDTSNLQLKAYKNNSLQGTLTLASPQSDYIFTAICLGGSYTANFGQDSSFAGAKTAQGNTDDNEQGDFYYAVPTGFYSLCTKNLAEFG